MTGGIMLRPLALFLLLLLPLEEGHAMSLFSKNVLFSAVKGQVLLNGQPVSGAEVERSWEWAWNSSKGEDKVKTDASGRFAFAAVAQSAGTSKFMPHEPVVFQNVVIRHQGKSYVAWQFTKHNYDDNGELKGKALSMHCELSKAPVDNGRYFGICEMR
jgi:hypothetical protein